MENKEHNQIEKAQAGEDSSSAWLYFCFEKERDMKTTRQIELALDNVQHSFNENERETRYPEMTYEEGVKEALLWVLGQIPEDEFPYDIMLKI